MTNILARVVDSYIIPYYFAELQSIEWYEDNDSFITGGSRAHFWNKSFDRGL